MNDDVKIKVVNPPSILHGVDQPHHGIDSQDGKILDEGIVMRQRDAVIDALVEKVILAESRRALIAACKALDRVLRSGRYWVPHWYKASHWLAYWDVFGRPESQPHYAPAVRETWWANGQ